MRPMLEKKANETRVRSRNSVSWNSGNVPFVDTGIPDSRIGIPGMSVLARTWNGPN